MESSLVDFRDFSGPVAGTLAPLSVGDAIKAMGFTLLNRANNHALDGGVAGMLSTDRALDALGIVHAGSGRNLQEARAPAYLETPKGRVALVGMYAVEDVGNFGPTYAKTEATLRNGNVGGGAGINPLHLTTYHVVSPEHLQTLRKMALAIYGERAAAWVPASDGRPDRFRFFDEWYEAGGDPGALRYEINPTDEREMLRTIRNGKVYADFLIATIHSHQITRFCARCAFGGTGGIKEETDHDAPDYLVRFARASIDAGADMFVTHGVHALAGIEIYKGRPIFYGLSNFVFQFGLQFGPSDDVLANEKNLAPLENPSSQQAILAKSRYEGGRLVEVKLYPVELGGPRRPLSQMGIPRVPPVADANAILRAMQEYSRRFGTVIAIDKGVGTIRVR
jgi:poly-gamma-glutamate synthesis protein (capsule biosynthesis protein)